MEPLEIIVTMIAILMVWAMLSIVLSDQELIVSVQSIAMVLFLLLAFQIGQPAFVFYIFYNQVMAVRSFWREITGKSR